MPLNQNKYEQAILYLCRNLGGQIRGKKKLAKLLYFADFDFFEKEQKTITGDIYKALPMGPFPAELDNITSQMAQAGILKIETMNEHEGYIPTEIFRSIAEPDVSVFEPEEIKMLERIATKYGHLNGRQLEELTHAEAPYIGTELKKEIPFELAYYRGTDFNDV